MNDDTQQAYSALHTIAQAETAARRNGLNNGVVPLVWGVMVFVCMADFDVFPFAWAIGLCFAVPGAMTVWTIFYQRCLPVKPLKMEKPLLFTLWGIYHATVLIGGMALGTHFWQRPCLPHGEWTLLGVLDAAPLFWVGWDQRRRTLGERR